jgi:hypothetical protein
MVHRQFNRSQIEAKQFAIHASRNGLTKADMIFFYFAAGRKNG